MKTFILAGVLTLAAVSDVVISALPTASVLTLTAVAGVFVASQTAEAGGTGTTPGRRPYSAPRPRRP